MKTSVISASSIDGNLSLTLESYDKSYERRIKRLWQIGTTPRKLATALEVAVERITSDLDRLCGSPNFTVDGKTNIERSIEASKRNQLRRKQSKIDEIDTDLAWFGQRKHLFSREEVANYFGVQLESLSHHQRRCGVFWSEPKSKIEQRNTAIIHDYNLAVENDELRGIISTLASRYSVSRKTIDNVLGDKKIITTPKAKRTRSATIEKKYQSMLHEYESRIGAAKNVNQLLSELALEFGYKSRKGVIKALDSARSLTNKE